MKIKIDLTGYDVLEFKTKEEYDAHPWSEASYEQYRTNRSGSRGLRHRFYTYPTRFPCIFLETDIWYNPKGEGIWLYDYEVLDEEQKNYGVNVGKN